MLSDSGMTAEQLDDRFARLEALMRAESAETRRHFDVVADGLRLEIRVIAEGHDVLRADVGELKAGQERLEAGLGRLEIRQQALVSSGARRDTPGRCRDSRCAACPTPPRVRAVWFNKQHFYCG